MIRTLLLLALVLAGAPALRAETVLPRQAVVSSAHALATDAGLEVLADGGNAFDAAVAVSATLGLVEPESSGLGGGGFFLLRPAKGDAVFVDARERAPLASTRDMYLDENGEPVRDRAVNGALAAGIPGLAAALDHVARGYGRLPLSRSLAPAIRLAREGWTFGRKNQVMLGFRREVLAKSPGAAALFLRDGQVPELGAVMRNPDYAAVLERLAADGAESFYRGDFARRLVEGVREAGGIWTLDDLASYRVVEREPIRLDYRGVEILTAPPPSSGGIALAQVLNVLSGYELPALAEVDRVHLTVEAFRRAFRDRALLLGDPDFVEVPLRLLGSPDYAAGLRASIHPMRATPSDLLPGVGDVPVRPDTTHFSIIDTEGNMVAVTQTVNLPYGNALVVPGTGFLLNNEMDDFSVKAGVPNAFGLVGEDANAIEPGKRPLSSMTPTILVGQGRAAVLGTPGGSRIITAVILGVLELLEGADAQAVAALPRYHHQYLPDLVSYEAGALDEATLAELARRGHRLEPRERTWGNMQVATWNLADGSVQAGSDPRWKDVGKGATGLIYR